MNFCELLILVIFLELVTIQAGPCTKSSIDNHPNIHLINRRTKENRKKDGPCGTSQASRFLIRGGEEVIHGRKPWMVRVYNVRPKGISACGGTLINTRYVLTAAHCTYPKDPNALHVFFPEGNYNLENCRFAASSSRPCAYKYRRVQTVINHYQYSPITDYNDISLLRLVGEVTFNAQTNAICLDTSCTDKAAGLRVFASGWGYTYGDPDYPDTVTRTQQLQVTQLNISPCPHTYDSKDDEGLTSDNPYPVRSIPQQVCASSYDANRGFCAGDSGGPISYSKRVGSVHKSYQIGVISFGPPCVDNNQYYRPHHSTNIRFYLSWILDNIRQ